MRIRTSLINHKCIFVAFHVTNSKAVICVNMKLTYNHKNTLLSATNELSNKYAVV